MRDKDNAHTDLIHFMEYLEHHKKNLEKWKNSYDFGPGELMLIYVDEEERVSRNIKKLEELLIKSMGNLS